LNPVNLSVESCQIGSLLVWACVQNFLQWDTAGGIFLLVFFYSFVIVHMKQYNPDGRKQFYGWRSMLSAKKIAGKIGKSVRAKRE
jgi:hypothetical protein